jgi:hypothetical protein
MNRFSALSKIEVRHDGRELKITINGSEMKPTELVLDDTDLEDLTMQFLQLALLCAQKQGVRPATDPAKQVRMYPPLRIDNFGTMSSPHPEDTTLVMPLGLFALGFSVPSRSLPPDIRATS